MGDSSDSSEESSGKMFLGIKKRLEGKWAAGMEREKEKAAREQARERQQLDELVNRGYLQLDVDSIPLIRKHIDYFVEQSRSNKTMTGVYFCVYSLVGQDDVFWDKLGQAIGNFQALKMLLIQGDEDSDDDSDDDTEDNGEVEPFPDDDSGDDEEVESIPESDHEEDEDDDEDKEESDHKEEEEEPIPEWEILARILSHVRQRIILTDEWRAENARSFARAIRGHPTITCFESDTMFPYEASDALYSALATLPALESITLSNRQLNARPEDESALANPESLMELLRVPSLRSVYFETFHFTSALCHATANALMEGTLTTKIEFRNCSFSASGECPAIMAKGLTRNTSVISIEVAEPSDEVIISAVTAALPSNSTLRELSFLHCSDAGSSISAAHLSSLFLALGKNTGIKSLKCEGFGSMDESLCIAIRDGLGINQTLERLHLEEIPLCDDTAALWSKAFSFLRTNKSIRSLVVHVKNVCVESCLSAFLFEIASMLQDNTSLESLSFRSNGIKMIAEEHFVLVTALQQNTALKSLTFYWRGHFTEDESKQLASLLKKNYVLERLPYMEMMKEAEDVRAILRLNKAGRRYLIEDGSSISRGVEVLSRVNNDINCVFLHLLENPRLCDRRAVEVVVTAGESNGGSTNPTGSSGGVKREQASVLKGRESRRRLA
jgi:hypothetical protein